MQLIDYIVNSDVQLSSAIEKMTNNKIKGLVVLENEKVYGVFTRRDLVNCSHVFGLRSIPIKPFVNTKFEYAIQSINSKQKQSNHTLIPIIDENFHLIDIFFPQKKNIVKKIGYPVVIMAGGLGTRLYPYTKVLPKPLVPVIDDKPMVELIMDTFYNFGCSDFYLIVNHKKDMIKSYFKENILPYSVNFGEEKKQLGTGGGLYYIKDKIRETFFLTNCDILTLENYDEIYEYHKNSKNAVTMVVSLKSVHIPYGVILTDESQNIVGSKEKPTYMILVNTGVYVVDPIIFQFINKEERIDFPSVIERLKTKGLKVGVYPITEDKWLDMGQINELESSKKRLNTFYKSRN